jgi:hypothetical protein
MLKTGGCHCGAVKFEVNISENPVVAECNCSICSKSGYLHLKVHAESFRLVSGKEFITTYTFNTGVAQHYFCKICGIKSFYVPRSNPEGFSVNFRCLDNAENIEYSLKHLDGKNWKKHAVEFQILAK